MLAALRTLNLVLLLFLCLLFCVTAVPWGPHVPGEHCVPQLVQLSRGRGRLPNQVQLTGDCSTTCSLQEVFAADVA
jgi:hypothetical protein